MPSAIVLKSFRAGGELHVPGTILNVAETSLCKLAGFIKILPEISPTLKSEIENTPEITEKFVDVIPIKDTRKPMGAIIPFPSNWLKSFNETQLERLAIMTVDGGLTDDEALRAIRLCGTLLPSVPGKPRG
jgi:hypothetical protein